MKSNFLRKILNVVKYFLIYYLSIKMITFAIPKLLFMQFRIPNYSSYVTLAELSKYEHMWSFFGRSQVYNIFIGSAEFLIGSLILFKRTRLIGLLISFGVCLNILILNIEFEITFAISHIIFDFLITLILLFEYRKDLYQFFLSLGGKINGMQPKKSTKFSRIFPLVFLIIVSIGYFGFSIYIKSTYIGDPNKIGAYEIKKIEVNDSTFIPQKGNIGKYPMLFVENNNEIAIAIENTLYKGGYFLDGDSIKFGIKNHTKFGMKYFVGKLDSTVLIGVIDKDQKIKMFLNRIDGKENYINDLYK